MGAKLSNLNHCAVPLLSRADVTLPTDCFLLGDALEVGDHFEFEGDSEKQM